MFARFCRSRFAIALAGAAAAVVLVAGCGTSSQATRPAAAPSLTVVTAAYPLQQAVNAIGQGRVSALDLAPPGTDPSALTLSAGQVDQVHAAGLVVEVGGGYQPALAQAASQANVVTLLPSVGGTNPEVWLDPARMQKAVSTIAAAMVKADPQAKSLFDNGARDFLAELQSVQIDYQETLSDCSTRAIVTPDNAFVATANDYGFTDVVVGSDDHPTADAVARAAAAIRASGATTAFTEPWIPTGTVAAAAAQAHVKVKALDTLAGPPPEGWPAGATYFGLIEQDLSAFQSALQCAQMEDQ